MLTLPKATLALAIYIVLLALPPLIAATQFFDLLQARAQLSEQTSRLLRLEAGRKSGPDVASSLPDGVAVFEASTATLAAAHLQERLSTLLGRHGATVLASQATATPEGALSRLQLSADFILRESELPGLLFDVEVNRPFLFVEALSVRKRDEAGDGMLRLTLRIHSFARGGG